MGVPDKETGCRRINFSKVRYKPGEEIPPLTVKLHRQFSMLEDVGISDDNQYGIDDAGHKLFRRGSSSKHNGYVISPKPAAEYYRVCCFAPETLVATPVGDIPIKELVGTATLLVPNKKGLGHWRPVEVRSFGCQPLLTVRLRRRNTEKIIRATPDHRWVISGRIGLYSQKVTAALKHGDQLASCFHRNLASYGDRKPTLSAIGVAQGFTFGDGSKERGSRRPAVVRFYAAKDKALIPYFMSCRLEPVECRGKIMQQVQDLPRSWKEVPDADESLSFLFGWLAGYFAADGHVSRSGKQAILTSSNKSHLQFAKGVCYQLGVGVSPIRPVKRVADGCVPGGIDMPHYGLTINVRDLPIEFWIQVHHRARVRKWLARSVGDRYKWVVVSVEDKGEEDEVFCAVVPGVEKFTLADNLLTMNCPYCNDTRHRLWVNYMYAQLDDDGNRLTYLAHCYNEQCMSVPGRRRHLEELLLGFRNVSERQPACAVLPGSTEPVVLTEVQLPGHTIPLLDLPPDHSAVQFLMGQRRYTAAMVQKYQIGYCIGADPRYPTALGRIIFPVYFNQQLVGWQARHVGDVNWNAMRIAKYYTLPGFRKSLAVYNIDTARHKEFVVVCEGVTDVHVGGDHFVALFGKNLHQHQRQLLQNIGDRKPLIFLLDSDAREEIEGIIHSFLMSPGQHPVLPVYLPEGFDPGDYDRTTLWNLITVEAHNHGLPIRFTS
jgi:hypothetical protein